MADNEVPQQPPPPPPPPNPASRVSAAEDSSRSGGGARFVSAIALLLALAAIGAASWAVVMAWPKPKDTPQPTAESKQKVCAAFDTVSKAVQLQTHLDLGPDPVAATAVAANARLALMGGAQYLAGQVDEHTAPDIADGVKAFTNALNDIAVNALAGATNDDPQQTARITAGEAARTKLIDLCK
jgi:hypothetical protein